METPKPMTFESMIKGLAQGLKRSTEHHYYRTHPEEYLALFGKPWGKQKEIIRSVRDNSITLVRSCNDVGKTWTAAAIVLWFLDVYRPNATVITTAKSYDSVRFMLWAAIRQAYKAVKPRFNNMPMNLTDFTPDKDQSKWFAVGYNPKIEGSPSDPESEAPSFQGHHNRHVLFLVDEAITTHPAIWRAIEGSLMSKGSRLLAIFNPTSTQGEIVQMEQDQRGNLITISAYDLFESEEYKTDPEYFRELVNPDKAQGLIDTYGKDSPIVQARIFGEYPTQDTNAAISINGIMKCIERYDTLDIGEIQRVIWAWDVAGEGRDSNVLGVLYIGEEGLSYEELESWSKIKHTESMQKVYHIIKDTIDTFEKMQDGEDQIEYVLVPDAVGEGSHVPSFMQEWLPKINVVAFKGGMKAKKILERREVELFNRVSEAWYRAHLIVERKIPTWLPLGMKIDKQTIHELSQRRAEWRVTKSEPQVYQIEPKEKYKERNRGKSPDAADTFIMAMWAYSHATSIEITII